MKKLKLAALLAAVIVGLGLYQFLQELKKPQEAPHTTVVVASVDVPENTRITPEMVALKSISNDSLLDHYLTDTESVVGMVVTSDVYAGEQIIRDRLVRVGEAEFANQTLAYAVKPDMRAITIFVDQDTGLVNFLKPGNRVDVLANYSHEETRPVLNRNDELEWVQIPTSQLLAQNILVLAVGTSTGKTGAEEYTTVTLEVTPQEALDIDAVAWWGGIRLILRSPLDDKFVQPGPVDQHTVCGEDAGA